MRWLAVRLGVNNYKHDHIKLVLNKFAPAARRTKNCWVLPVCAVHWHLLCQLCCFSRIDHIGKPQYLSSMLNHPKYLSTHWPLTHLVLKSIGCFYDSYPPELELKLSRELCFAVAFSGSSTVGSHWWQLQDFGTLFLWFNIWSSSETFRARLKTHISNSGLTWSFTYC